MAAYSKRLGSLAGSTASDDAKTRTQEFLLAFRFIFYLSQHTQCTHLTLENKAEMKLTNALSKIFSVFLLLSSIVCSISFKSRLRQCVNTERSPDQIASLKENRQHGYIRRYQKT